MSGQMIIVYVIGVAVGAYLVYRIYRVVAGKRRGGRMPQLLQRGGKTAAAGSPRSGPVEPAGSVRSIFVETD